MEKPKKPVAPLILGIIATFIALPNILLSGAILETYFMPSTGQEGVQALMYISLIPLLIAFIGTTQTRINPKFSGWLLSIGSIIYLLFNFVNPLAWVVTLLYIIAAVLCFVR
jgi:hypothetical protein